MSENMLVPIDFSDVTTAVLYEAKRIAKALHFKIHLVHVKCTPSSGDYDYSSFHLRDPIVEDIEREQEQLEAMAKALRDEGLDVDSTFLQGSPAGHIVEQMGIICPDFIVLGSHGHGAMANLITGSVCRLVSLKASCPVLIVPSKFLPEVEELEHQEEYDASSI